MKEREPKWVDKRLNKYADEIYSDDGRRSDGKDHKGDWGSHSRADRVIIPRIIKSKTKKEGETK